MCMCDAATPCSDVSFPLPVHLMSMYKGKHVCALLFGTQKFCSNIFVYNTPDTPEDVRGHFFTTVGGAASKIFGSSRNGNVSWLFFNPKSKSWQFIRNLRTRGPIPQADKHAVARRFADAGLSAHDAQHYLKTGMLHRTATRVSCVDRQQLKGVFFSQWRPPLHMVMRTSEISAGRRRLVACLRTENMRVDDDDERDALKFYSLVQARKLKATEPSTCSPAPSKRATARKQGPADFEGVLQTHGLNLFKKLFIDERCARGGLQTAKSIADGYRRMRATWDAFTETQRLVYVKMTPAGRCALQRLYDPTSDTHVGSLAHTRWQKLARDAETTEWDAFLQTPRTRDIETICTFMQRPCPWKTKGLEPALLTPLPCIVDDVRRPTSLWLQWPGEDCAFKVVADYRKLMRAFA